MHINRNQKKYSIVATFVLLLNLFTPLAAYATSEPPADDPTNENETSTVFDLLNLENEENEIIVEGYIVGQIHEDEVLRENFIDDTNIALADDPEEVDLENLLFVELPEEYTAEFGLQSNPALLDEQVTLTGTLPEELGQNGLTDVAEIKLISDEASENPADELEEETPEEVEETEEASEEEPVEEEVTEDTEGEPATEESDEVVEEAAKETSEAEGTAEEASPIQPFQEAPIDSFELSLMHMNDTHARVDSYPSMVTAVNSFRNANPEALLLHAGDVFSGTLYFNEFLGLADLEIMKLMDIDAFAFGNHEFDLGDSADGHSALADFVADSNFPYLGTNIDFSSDPSMARFDTNASLEENPSDGQIYDSIVFDVEGEQVGVFGLTTEDTANIASPASVTFTNYINAAEEAVAELEAAGIDKIIALTHMGYDSAPAYGNDIILANQVDGIDVIVGGHSHTALETPDLVEGGSAPTVIVQAGANADNLGTLNVTFDENGEIVDHAGELLSVGDYDPDPEAAAILAPYAEQIEAINNEETGATAMKELTNPRHGDGDEVSVRANETELGNLVTDAMLAKTKELYPETVIAFQNGGGIRAPIAEGPITVGEVIEVLPFGNNPVVVELSGQELKDIFEISVSADERLEGGLGENGGFLQVSGMELYFDSTREEGDRVVAMYVEENGQLNRIQLDENYLVTTNAFTGQGGDGLTPLADAYAEGRVQDTGAIDWEQLRDYMVEEQYLNGVVDPVLEGRITDLLGEDYAEYQITRLRNQIAELEEILSNLETENANLAAEINVLRELLASLQADLEAGNAELAELEQRIADLEARLSELEDAVEEEDEQGEEDEQDDANGQNGTDDANGKDDDNGTDSSDPNGKDDQTGSKKRKDKDDVEKGALPATGSASMLITFIGGTTFVVSGLGVEVWRRKKSKK